LAYQPPANITFLSEQISHQQSASSTFLLEQTSTSHQPNEQATSGFGPLLDPMRILCQFQIRVRLTFYLKFSHLSYSKNYAKSSRMTQI
jgi:hypothetical protein